MADSQTFGGIRPALRARLPARGLPPHPFGALGPAHRERPPKPRALSGRGDRLGNDMRAQLTPLAAAAMLTSRCPGLLGLGLVLRVFVPQEQPVAERADGFIIGAQASEDARALRRSVGSIREALKDYFLDGNKLNSS